MMVRAEQIRQRTEEAERLMKRHKEKAAGTIRRLHY
jgi:hypothetical protein